MVTAHLPLLCRLSVVANPFSPVVGSTHQHPLMLQHLPPNNLYAVWSSFFQWHSYFLALAAVSFAILVLYAARSASYFFFFASAAASAGALPAGAGALTLAADAAPFFAHLPPLCVESEVVKVPPLALGSMLRHVHESLRQQFPATLYQPAPVWSLPSQVQNDLAGTMTLADLGSAVHLPPHAANFLLHSHAASPAPPLQLTSTFLPSNDLPSLKHMYLRVLTAPAVLARAFSIWPLFRHLLLALQHTLPPPSLGYPHRVYPSSNAPGYEHPLPATLPVFAMFKLTICANFVFTSAADRHPCCPFLQFLPLFLPFPHSVRPSCGAPGYSPPVVDASAASTAPDDTVSRDATTAPHSLPIAPSHLQSARTGSPPLGQGLHFMPVAGPFLPFLYHPHWVYPILAEVSSIMPPSGLASTVHGSTVTWPYLARPFWTARSWSALSQGA